MKSQKLLSQFHMINPYQRGGVPKIPSKDAKMSNLEPLFKEQDSPHMEDLMFRIIVNKASGTLFIELKC